MKRVLFLILGFYLLNGFTEQLQHNNYIQYHKVFGEIEELIVNEKFKPAELRLDTLFKSYQVKFSKDYVIAAQISLMNGHKEKAIKFLIHSIKMGVKIECLESIRFLKENITGSEWKSLKAKERLLRKDYLKSINLKMYEEFHKRYQEEQDAKRTERYKSIVYSNFSRIKNILDNGHFIGESLIGIDNKRFAKSISDCDFGNSRIIVTLLHYDYSFSEIGEDRFITAIEKGNLHPREFATIYNFEKNRLSVLYKNSKKEYKQLPEYKFNFPFEEKTLDIERVNEDRLKFGIAKYEVDTKKEKVSRKYGIKLNFNYR